MSGSSTEEAKVLLKVALLLLLSEFAVFSELGGEVRGGLLLVGAAAARVATAGVTGVTRIARVALPTRTVLVLVSIGSGVSVGIALALIIGTLRLVVSAQISSGHLGVMFPVMRVDGLGKGAEVGEGVGFADMGDFILDLGWKSMIQLSVEGSVTPLDISSKVVEVNEVLHNVLVIMYAKILKFGFCFTLGVVQSKIILQFCNEVRVVIEPGWTFSGGQQWFKPIQCGPFEIGQCKGDFGTVRGECVRMVSKVKCTLD